MSDRIAFAGKVEADGRRLRGEVVLAGSRTWRNNEWLEIDPAAVVKADAAGIFASWEHDDSKILASSGNGTLRVNRTETGFTYETDDLPNTSYANDALELVHGGYVTGTSFEIEGLRSSFSTDPDGTRVRRITKIARLRQVGPVRDPAFVNSSVAAFSKESTDMGETIVEPTAPVAPAPVITPAPKADDRSETYRTAEAFAKRQDTKSLEEAMGNLIAGGLESAPRRETYDAFAAEYDRRTANDTESREHAERIALAHAMRTGKGPAAPKAQRGATESEDYRQAFGQYLRTGRPELMEQFAQSVSGDGTQGGFLVPDGFVARVTERLKAFGGIARHAEELVTSTGESLRWTSNDDTGNAGAIATEGTAVASGGADLAFEGIELGAYEYDATGTGNLPVKVSKTLLQDSAFNLEALIERKLSQRIGRKQATHFATGTGNNQPVGLLTKAADTMTATAVSLAIPEHILQVDSEYRDMGNCRWILSDTSLLKIWQSQDTTNRPMIVPGQGIDGKPSDLLWGYPYQIDPAAGDLVAFGDIREGYIIRRVRAIEILVDPYSYNSARQVAYHAWARADATINDGYAYSVSDWSTVSADT